MAHYHTPRNQLTKGQSNEYFDYRDGDIYWKVRNSNRVSIVRVTGMSG
jgi:hypothetical protein